ncbi:hypothetical protein ACKC9G_12450 [Pokkaliibacter sp. CJK22405]|uniref:hypothetical protein n=1 Tax=Pokkaliibacter sp. CJK22405 TaxID=3384615 RepID=UPI003984FEEA
MPIQGSHLSNAQLHALAQSQTLPKAQDAHVRTGGANIGSQGVVAGKLLSGLSKALESLSNAGAISSAISSVPVKNPKMQIVALIAAPLADSIASVASSLLAKTSQNMLEGRNNALIGDTHGDMLLDDMHGSNPTHGPDEANDYMDSLMDRMGGMDDKFSAQVEGFSMQNLANAGAAATNASARQDRQPMMPTGLSHLNLQNLPSGGGGSTSHE